MYLYLLQRKGIGVWRAGKGEPGINADHNTAVLHNLEPCSNQLSDTAVKPGA